MSIFSFRLLPGVLLLGVVSSATGQSTDSTLARVQRLVNAGDRPSARVLADSLLSTASDGSPAYAEALYARAFASSGAADAERDYLRVSIEYPFSPRAEDAIMMVAQLKMARSDRAGARRSFERLAREYPNGAQTAKAAFWAGRLALEDGDVGRGCPSLAQAKARVTASDVELSNQIEYYAQRCTSSRADVTTDTAMTAERSVQPTPPPPPSSTRSGRGPRKSTTASPPGPPPTTAPKEEVLPKEPRVKKASLPQKRFSVQVAAFPKKRDALALSDVLLGRGFEARVWGTKAPFRVRVGHYSSREEAAMAVARMKASRVSGIVVESEPK